MSTAPKSNRTLEERLREIEDRLEIYNLIAAHPPSADTGASDYVASVWTEDGVFDRGEQLSVTQGRDAISSNVGSAAHRAAIDGGLAHFTGLPHIEIDGDTAFVTSYLQILVPRKTGESVSLSNHGESLGFHIHRVTSNRWELVRTAEGWKIKHRTLRLLDGSDAARALLRQALTPSR